MNITIQDIMSDTVEENEESPEELFVVLYQSMIYLLALVVAGDLLCGKFLRMVPPLVGQIAIGISLGPNGLDFISESMIPCWPLLGELGLVFMLCQAGLEMDLQVLQTVGPRGALMALIGSILPTSIGFLLAYIALDLSVESALAVGCSFGPTSAGIALNVLQPCHVLQTPLGQLIVAIAIVDDIIALVVLSQLQALTADTISASAIAIPIISGLLWLFMGGGTALYIMPGVLSKISQCEQSLFGSKRNKPDPKTIQSNNGKNQENEANGDERDNSLNVVSDDAAIKDERATWNLVHLIVLLFALLPATYYSQASHLLGAFLVGLSSCQDEITRNKYNDELDKIIGWLLRIFFGASIAFAIPVQLFFQEGGGKVIGTGCLLSLSLLGKIMTGPLLTPVELKVKEDTQPDYELNELNDGKTKNETNNCDSSPDSIQSMPLRNPRKRFDQQHRRDCLVVGFSMAGEAEFAMLVAGFGFREGLLEEDIYASTVFAILLSTIISPCLLRLTLAFSSSDDNMVSDDNDQQPSTNDGADESPQRSKLEEDVVEV